MQVVIEEKKHQHKYCDAIFDGSAVKASCPLTCGICRGNLSGKGNKGTKYPKPSKTPGKDSQPSLLPTQSPSGEKVTISPGKGKTTKEIKMPKQVSKGKTTKESKMPKQVSKGKTPKQVSKGKTTKVPGKGSKATASPSLLPSTSPTADASVVFSVEVCYQGCGNLAEVEGADVLQEKVLQYAFGSVDTGSFSVGVTSPESDCVPCEFVNERKRILQNNDIIFLKSRIMFEITAPEQGIIDDVTLINNLNTGLPQLNEDLNNEAALFQFIGVIEDATSQEPSLSPATRTPVASPTGEPPSPPPQELSTRRIAEQINQYYMVPQEMQKIQEPDNMLDMLDRPFDYAQDVEDKLMHSNPEPLNYNSTSGIRFSADGSHDYYADMPDFVYQDVTDPLKCKCLDCDEDDVCGGLWKGKRYPEGGLN